MAFLRVVSAIFWFSEPSAKQLSVAKASMSKSTTVMKEGSKRETFHKLHLWAFLQRVDGKERCQKEIALYMPDMALPSFRASTPTDLLKRIATGKIVQSLLVPKNVSETAPPRPDEAGLSNASDRYFRTPLPTCKFRELFEDSGSKNNAMLLCPMSPIVNRLQNRGPHFTSLQRSYGPIGNPLG